ncbi:MAG: hypothetical protein C0604_04750 [Clostridiales bacterium]|nr:MAG: hypothetical protein C0604_04750 [Clostridiales bacterium]
MGFYSKMVPDGTYCINGYKGSEKHVVFPKNIVITILHDDLFKGHAEIESVELPDTVTEIGGFIFDGCTGLKSIKLPQNLRSMWQYEFTRTSIEEIEIPGSVESIIPFTFFQSNKLRKVFLNEGTTKISAWAFKECTALTDVYLPSSLSDISDKAFEDCGEINFHKA